MRTMMKTNSQTVVREGAYCYWLALVYVSSPAPIVVGYPSRSANIVLPAVNLWCIHIVIVHFPCPRSTGRD